MTDSVRSVTNRRSFTDEELVEQWDLVLSATASAHRRVLRRIEDSGVPGPWFAVLHTLLRAEDYRLPMSRLAKDLSITSGGFTKLADRMAREGLIDRRGSSGDRRVVYATLTPTGLEMAKRLVADYRSAVRENVGEILNEDQLAGLASAMHALSEAHPVGPELDEDEDDHEEERRGPLPPRR
jgi:DNA-binding MarR family transcriptional regulator